MKEVIDVYDGAGIILAGFILTVATTTIFVILERRNKAKIVKAELDSKNRSEKIEKIRTLTEDCPLRVVVRKSDKNRTTLESELIKQLISFGVKIVSVEEREAVSILSSKVETDQGRLFNSFALVGFDLTTKNMNEPFCSIDLRLIQINTAEDEVIHAVTGVFSKREYYEYEDLRDVVESIVDTLLQHFERRSANT
jgi:hypothetical protein